MIVMDTEMTGMEELEAKEWTEEELFKGEILFFFLSPFKASSSLRY